MNIISQMNGKLTLKNYINKNLIDIISQIIKIGVMYNNVYCLSILKVTKLNHVIEEGVRFYM